MESLVSASDQKPIKKETDPGVTSPTTLPTASNAQIRPYGPFAPSSAPSIVTTIKNVDMPEPQQEYALQLGQEAVLYESSLRDMAGHIKRHFDAKYGPTWHCVVGKSYGCYCTHEGGAFIFFYVDSLAVMLFKTA